MKLNLGNISNKCFIRIISKRFFCMTGVEAYISKCHFVEGQDSIFVHSTVLKSFPFPDPDQLWVFITAGQHIILIAGTQRLWHTGQGYASTLVGIDMGHRNIIFQTWRHSESEAQRPPAENITVQSSRGTYDGHFSIDFACVISLCCINALNYIVPRRQTTTRIIIELFILNDS